MLLRTIPRGKASSLVCREMSDPSTRWTDDRTARPKPSRRMQKVKWRIRGLKVQSVVHPVDRAQNNISAIENYVNVLHQAASATSLTPWSSPSNRHSTTSSGHGSEPHVAHRPADRHAVLRARRGAFVERPQIALARRATDTRRRIRSCSGDIRRPGQGLDPPAREETLRVRRRSNARAAHSPDRRDLRPSSGRDPVRPELITQGRRWRCLVHDLGGARGGRRATRGFVCQDVEIWHRGAVGITGQGPATWACRPAWAGGPGQGDRGCGSAGRAPTLAMSGRRCECSRNRYSSCSPSSVSVGAAPARPRHRRDIAGGCPSSPERLLGCPAAATTLLLQA